MKVIHLKDANAFYARVEPYLLPREAEHNLTFGLLANVRSDPGRFPEPMLALVEEEGALRLVALRTDWEHGLVLSLTDSAQAVTALATDLHAGGLTLVGVNGPSEVSGAFADIWSRLSGKSYRVNTPMRTFKLEQVAAPSGVPGALRRASPADRDLLIEWEIGFHRDAFPDEEFRRDDIARMIDYRLASRTGGIYVWDDGGVVSYTGYGGPTPHGIRIGPVYTPPELRGRGYASACVAAVSQTLLDSGRQFCFLFTDLRNPTSNHIYQVIGYRPVCDFTDYRFSG